jgi:teichoic acid transport system permease protein
VVFFKDLTQVVTIFLQVFIWITPIMWQDTQMLGNHPVIARLIQLNPMYYIVYGYRDAMINHVWFWEKPGMTLYFWIVTVLLFVLGTGVFKRLRPHFADVI